MAEFKIVPVTSRSRRIIENKVLDLLKFVRENECHQIAFVAVCDDPVIKENLSYYMDYADTEDYEMDSLIIGVDDLLETLDDVYYGVDEYEDE